LAETAFRDNLKTLTCVSGVQGSSKLGVTFVGRGLLATTATCVISLSITLIAADPGYEKELQDWRDVREKRVD
jgi:hypothetical protein